MKTLFKKNKSIYKIPVEITGSWSASTVDIWPDETSRFRMNANCRQAKRDFLAYNENILHTMRDWQLLELMTFSTDGEVVIPQVYNSCQKGLFQFEFKITMAISNEPHWFVPGSKPDNDKEYLEQMILTHQHQTDDSPEGFFVSRPDMIEDVSVKVTSRFR